MPDPQQSLRSQNSGHRWMSAVLVLAGIYNLAWGSAVIVAPQFLFQLAGFSLPLTHPAIWQCVGMIVAVYGIGYVIASRSPFVHWPIVLVGLLGKILGPIGFVMGVVARELPASLGWTILLNDVVWWIPFAMILWGAMRHHFAQSSAHSAEFLDDDPVRELTTAAGTSLYDLSFDNPQLVVFLRHAGCTFCREALSDLSQQRSAIDEMGVGIVVVHLGTTSDGVSMLDKYDLAHLPIISDPEARLYRQFGLELGSFGQLLGLKVWLRGVVAGLLAGHGIGHIVGDPFQMPGAFVVQNGRFLTGFQHETAADRPQYIEIVRDAVQHEAAVVH